MANTAVTQQKNMQKYIIGIDTGGTFTDAVLLETESEKVIATAKLPTTHHQLALATGAVLGDLLSKTGVSPAQIATVAVSSTLATNSVVENKGARVAVIVIGYVKHFKLPVKAVVYVKGGHTIQGTEEEPLDLDYLVELLNGLRKEVDSYGVCAAMSIKNPTHEQVVEKAIQMIDPKPVFCSHRISQQAGMQERAATAGLHARLMPIMEEFIDGVNTAMDECGLHCPLIIIGGNGKPLKGEKAVAEAGLTVTSGPACTAHFGATANHRDCLVIDVGGTTTDITIIEEGNIQLTADGCQVGLWKTHVEAVDMHTGGIGGDSHVHVDEKGNLTIGPSRVSPLATTAAIPPVSDWLGPANRSRLIVLQPGAEDSLHDSELNRLLSSHRHLTPAVIRQETGLGGIPLDRQLEHLTRKQLIFECGFTPTDALHVVGEMEFGNTSAAAAAADILGEALNMSGHEFSRMVLRQTEELIENLVIDYIVQRYWNNSLTNFIASRKNHPVVGVDFSLRLPVIGIGAAARYFLPRVAANLHTTVEFPEHCEVGNAIGAALIAMSAMGTTINTG